MKNKRILITPIFLLICTFPILSQTTLEERDKQRQSGLITANQKKQEEILQKYNDFVNRVQTKFPGFKISSSPIDLKQAEGIADHNAAPGSKDKKFKSLSAIAAESFFLQLEPSYTISNRSKVKVKKGDSLEVVMVLKQDVTEKKEGPHWVLVRTKSKQEGYVTQDLLSQTKPAVKSRNTEGLSLDLSSLSGRISEPANNNYSESKKGKEMWVEASSLNMRGEPDVNAYVVARLPKGLKVKIESSTTTEDTIDGITSYWFQISSAYGNGWVFGGYLSSSEVVSYDVQPGEINYPQENPDELKNGEKRFVRSTSLRMRDEPNDYGSVVTTIPGDEKIKIIDSKKEIETIGGVRSKWLYVSWNDEWEGWIFGGFVSKELGPLVDSDDISKYFQIPVDNDRYVSSNFGTRVDPVTGKVGAFHSGIDLPASIGTPIKAVSDGKVWRTTTTSGGYGMLTILSHKNNIFTYYAHQNERQVKEGDTVRSGDIIGQVGNTGKSTGPHLHFEVRKGPDQQALDPDAYLPK
ncbi:peptidoglycan DD-metalloendopeptidase family protein [Leptospira bandrabouensis]|uniref:peptidoglycan DD-metalloendopeptidase family protein n=1 Tax=Leptospira bandrabouensis TaxID=2484903 RepID=UPI001EEA5030|nr:peptidoglycan DD-metalloendopeptidase family protein [Leptospira bandrabouensis]MCG6151566.1 peptidoglycan DD-metalloendopeptidase family protein [Leptospira bandrabouensis]